jgi:hypothetical protein
MALAFPGARLRPPRSRRVLYGLLAFSAALIAGIIAFLPELRVMMAIFAAVIAPPTAFAVHVLRRFSPPGGGRVEVHDDGLHVDGRLALARDTLVRAVVARDAGGVTVSIRRKQGFVAVVEVGSVEEGNALVRALGLSAEQALATFHVDSAVTQRLPPWAIYPYLALFPFLILPPIFLHHAWIAALLGAPWYAALIASSASTRITVGLDGVLVRWLWRRELIRYADLRAVDHDGERLHFHLEGGRRASFAVAWTASRFDPQGSGETGFASRGAYLDALVARIREAVGARGAAEERTRAVLLRKRRDIDTWMGALRALLARGARDFRDAATSPEDLWRTVEDGGADPATRAAAAVALGPALAGAEKERLRGVARVVVAPRLRVAMEAVADGDDERVREALAELEASEATRDQQRSRPPA